MAFNKWVDGDEDNGWILDASFGSLNFYVERYGYSEDGVAFNELIKLNSHVCTAEELGLIEGSSKAKFFKT